MDNQPYGQKQNGYTNKSNARQRVDNSATDRTRHPLGPLTITTRMTGYLRHVRPPHLLSGIYVP